MFRQVKTEASNSTVEITDEDRLKCELKRFGLKENNCHDKDLLTREQYIKLKGLRDNEQVIIRKSDESNSIFIMDRSDYLIKQSCIVGDKQKFTKLTKDSTKALKKKLNGLIKASNMSTNDSKLNKLVGHYK